MITAGAVEVKQKIDVTPTPKSSAPQISRTHQARSRSAPRAPRRTRSRWSRPSRLLPSRPPRRRHRPTPRQRPPPSDGCRRAVARDRTDDDRRRRNRRAEAVTGANRRPRTAGAHERQRHRRRHRRRAAAGGRKPAARGKRPSGRTAAGRTAGERTAGRISSAARRPRQQQLRSRSGLQPPASSASSAQADHFEPAHQAGAGELARFRERVAEQLVVLVFRAPRAVRGRPSATGSDSSSVRWIACL